MDIIDIETPVKEIIASRIGIDSSAIEPESDIEALGADSLDIISIIMDLENAFDIEIPEEAASKIHTVQDAINHISKYS